MPVTFCQVKESPKEETGRFISHSPPSCSLLLVHPDGQIQPEDRGQESLLMQFPSVRHTEKRKLPLEREKGEALSTAMWIAQIYPDLRKAGVLLSELLPTLTDSWMRS